MPGRTFKLYSSQMMKTQPGKVLDSTRKVLAQRLRANASIHQAHLDSLAMVEVCGGYTKSDLKR